MIMRIFAILVACGLLYTSAAMASETSQNPLRGWELYRETETSAQQQAEEWEESRPDDAALMGMIASQPQSKWFGDWNARVTRDVRNYVNAAAADSSMPVLVLYNIPYRDCGSYSAGGADSASAYETFIDKVANGIGTNNATVILEPDAVASISCLTRSQRQERYALLTYAIDTFAVLGNTYVYVDAGNANWISVATMAKRFTHIDIASAQGIALNVSNFYRTKRTRKYGKELSDRLGGVHMVIDTSRNGQGPTEEYEWCNPSGRGLGHAPTTATGFRRVDALLWVKAPGESDGTCNGGPDAGEWWPEYALELAQNRNL